MILILGDEYQIALKIDSESFLVNAGFNYGKIDKFLSCAEY
jgi:hypothetical protein